MGLLGNKHKNQNQNDMAYADPDGRHPMRNQDQSGAGAGAGGGNWQNDQGYDQQGLGGGGAGHHGGHHGGRHQDDFADGGYGGGQQGYGGAGAGTGVGVGAGGRGGQHGFDDDGYGGQAGQAGLGGPGGAAGAMGGGQGHGAGAATHPMQPKTDEFGNPVKPSGGSSMAGKVEAAVGTMIGSQSLKAKGEAKEQEARALKAQGAELNEAERLEAAARTRRERAVAHGAHPQLRNLGGQPPDVDSTGGGAGFGGQGGRTGGGGY